MRQFKNKNYSNVEGYLSCPDFAKNVAAIAHSLNVKPEEETFKDITQECAIAVIESYGTWDTKKCGGLEFFWGYAYKRMREYAKKECNKHRNIVDIPYNRTNSAFANETRKYTYDRITHQYSSLTYDNGDPIPIADSNPDIAAVMDITNAINKLTKERRTVFDMKMGFAPTKSGKTSFDDIAETLGIKRGNAIYLFNQAKKQLRAELFCYKNQ